MGAGVVGAGVGAFVGAGVVGAGVGTWWSQLSQSSKAQSLTLVITVHILSLIRNLRA